MKFNSDPSGFLTLLAIIATGLGNVPVVTCGPFEDFKNACNFERKFKNSCLFGPYCFGFSGQKVNLIYDDCHKLANIGKPMCHAHVSIKRVGQNVYDMALIGRLTVSGKSAEKGWVGIAFGKRGSIMRAGNKAIACIADKGKVAVHVLTLQDRGDGVDIPQGPISERKVLDVVIEPTIRGVLTNATGQIDSDAGGWIVCRFNLTSSHNGIDLFVRNHYIGLAGNMQRGLKTNLASVQNIHKLTGGYFGSSDKKLDFWTILRINYS